MAIVEMAIVLPFLVLLVLGIWEFSAGWQANLNVQASVRAGTRTGSSLGNDRAADYSILQAAKAGADQFATADIQRVVVYKATAAQRSDPRPLRQRLVLGGRLLQRVHGQPGQHAHPRVLHRHDATATACRMRRGARSPGA